MFRVPPFLAEGDTVVLIATARARSLDAVEPAIKILNSWGLKTELGKNALKVHHQFAGTDQERAEDLQWALDHPKAKAILINGGGYGALRIIDQVDLTAFSGSPKWLIGYSDTTVIHSRLLQLKIACIHATMAFQFTKNEEATFSIRKLLFGEQINYTVPGNPLNRPGNATADVVGGNLSLIYALSGSVDDLDTEGKILFIEDLDEQLYHLDRMMLQLKRSSKLNRLAGLIVGGMTEMKDNTVPFGRSPEHIIIDAVKDYHYPVLFDFPAGHIQKNMGLYLGKEGEMKVGESFSTFKQ